MSLCLYFYTPFSSFLCHKTHLTRPVERSPGICRQLTLLAAAASISEARWASSLENGCSLDQEQFCSSCCKVFRNLCRACSNSEVSWYSQQEEKGMQWSSLQLDQTYYRQLHLSITMVRHKLLRKKDDATAFLWVSSCQARYLPVSLITWNPATSFTILSISLPFYWVCLYLEPFHSFFSMFIFH